MCTRLHILECQLVPDLLRLWCRFLHNEWRSLPVLPFPEAARHLVAVSLRRCLQRRLTETFVQQRTYVLGQVQAENKQMQTMRAAFACHTQEPHLGTNFDRQLQILRLAISPRIKIRICKIIVNFRESAFDWKHVHPKRQIIHISIRVLG